MLAYNPHVLVAQRTKGNWVHNFRVESILEGMAPAEVERYSPRRNMTPLHLWKEYHNAAKRSKSGHAQHPDIRS
jgi:hypothetical protein